MKECVSDSSVSCFSFVFHYRLQLKMNYFITQNSKYKIVKLLIFFPSFLSGFSFADIE